MVSDQLVMGGAVLVTHSSARHGQANIGAHCARGIVKFVDSGTVQGIVLLNINFFVTGCR